MKKLILISIPVLVAGCSSAPKYSSKAEMEPETVISRIDGMDSRPSWIKESEPFNINDEKVTSLGRSEIAGDGNLNAAYRICFNNSKAAIANSIEQRLEFIFQNGEENTSIDSVTASYIGSEMSSLTTNSLRPSKQYYEKVALTNDSGQRRTVYRIFCNTEMPTSDFKRHMADAIRKAQGQGRVSADFKQKLDLQWNRFTQAPSDKREPSNSESAE